MPITATAFSLRLRLHYKAARVGGVSVQMRRILIFPLLASIISGCGGDPPTDEQMLSVFSENREVFSELRESLCVDGKRRAVMMDPEWSKPEVSPQEKEHFYHLFQSINARGVYYDGDCNLRIAVWSIGLGGDGDYKYYAHWPTGPRESEAIERSSLDSIDRSSLNIEFFYRPIEENWYLAFDHWP